MRSIVPEVSARLRDRVPGWLPEILLLVLLSSTLHLVGNARFSLIDRDEPRYAGATREMRASGDWILPTFNAEPRYHKPVLIYWLMLAGTAVGGDNPFGARLVSALAGTASVVITWLLGRRMFGATAGRWGALALATAPIFVLESKMATTDATLLVFMLGCQFAVWELGRGGSWRWAALFWTSLALATLTKGPIGPALLFASAVATRLISGTFSGWAGLIAPLWPDASGLDEGKRLRSSLQRGGRWTLPRTIGVAAGLFGQVFVRWLAANWGPLLFAAIVAPWFVAIGVRSRGEFFDVAFGRHVVHRATTGMETHGGFPGFYVALSIALFYPWSALLPVGLRAAWSSRRAEPAVGFLLGWILGPLVLLESVQTKLIHYYLPAYPACALLVGWVVPRLASSDANLRRWPMGRLSFGLLAGVGMTYALGLFAGVFALPGDVRWACLPMSMLLAVGTIHAVERIHKGATVRGLTTLAGVWAVVLGLFGGWFLPSAEPYRISPRVGRELAAMEREAGARPMLGAFKPPGVVYELGHPLPLMEGRMGLRKLLADDQPRAVALRADELERLRTFPEFTIETPGEPLVGFNVETFRPESLRMTIIRPNGSPPTIARGGEPALVE